MRVKSILVALRAFLGYMFSMKLLFNLRNSRIKEFIKVYRGGALLQIAAELKQWSPSRRSKREIRERYRTCLRCPIYNKQENSCLTMAGDRQLGCGCYVPYMIQVKDQCWGKQNKVVKGW